MRNVVLVTVDCLRARNVGYHGHHRETTPVLDDLARQGTSFERCFANGPYTAISFPSLLGSVYFNMYYEKHFPESVPLLSEAFSKRGYRTAGINAGNPNVSAAFGYDRGFDAFADFIRSDDLVNAGGTGSAGADSGRNPRSVAREALRDHDRLYARARRAYETATGGLLNPYKKARNYVRFLRGYTPNSLTNQVCPPADQVVGEAIRWLDSRDEDAPFFLWVHLMDPHSWYDPAPEHVRALAPDGEDISRLERFRANRALSGSSDMATVDAHLDTLELLYDAGIRQADAAIGDLRSALESRNLADETILAVTGDHGEEFREHGGIKHGGRLYEELIHVPLVVAGPDVESGRVATPVQLLDIPPTLLSAVGETSPDEYLGDDISGVLRSEDPTEKPVVSETPRGEEWSVGVRDHRYTYVRGVGHDQTELYDRDEDPREQSPVAQEPPDHLAERATDHVAFVESNPLDGVDREVSAEIERRLEDLGYK
jgi:arylsulfatase A-like enzyme